jgi:hypothetical protein
MKNKEIFEHTLDVIYEAIFNIDCKKKRGREYQKILERHFHEIDREFMEYRNKKILKKLKN